MYGDAAAFDHAVGSDKQHSAGPVQRSIDDGKNRILFGNLCHAAGFVVRRLAIRNASPNMNSEKSTRVARDSNNAPPGAG